MVQQATLASVLSEFARTLTTDFPIQGILDHLVGRIVEVLPVTVAGVTLISEEMVPHYIAASDAQAMRYEQLQTELGEGPCKVAHATGESVSVPDLASDGRFPRYGPPAVVAGLAAVWTFPLRHGTDCLGALHLYQAEVGELAAEDMAVAQTLADVATAYVLNARARDDTHAKLLEHQHNSLHDPLTGLPNRLLLEQRLEHAAQRAQRSHTIAAMLFVDLDRFKLVNDTYGHSAGDQLLLAVARRLSHLVRPGDTLARVSGDEFVILCEDLHDVTDAEALAGRIEDAFTAPFRIAGLGIEVSASVGMAFAGRGEAVTAQLLLDADAAMYPKKRARTGAHDTVDLTLCTGDRVNLARHLRTAMADGLLSVHYQPIVRLAGGRVDGVEALLRWHDPRRGWVPTCDIIGVAEEHGLIHEIGAWVLERACLDRAHWLRQHPSSPLDIAVNVSGRQLRRTDFLRTVREVIARTHTDATVLTLEVTESVLIEDTAHVVAVLAQLQDAGVRLALDDFGTGFCSLSYLRRLPVDIVKIDGSFVSDIAHDAAARVVLVAITQLAHALGLATVAEGVETTEQHAALRTVGCQRAQGYHFSAALPVDGISDLLAAADDLRVTDDPYLVLEPDTPPTAAPARLSRSGSGRVAGPARQEPFGSRGQWRGR